MQKSNHSAILTMVRVQQNQLKQSQLQHGLEKVQRIAVRMALISERHQIAVLKQISLVS